VAEPAPHVNVEEPSEDDKQRVRAAIAELWPGGRRHA
jgi:hypothetical protein